MIATRDNFTDYIDRTLKSGRCNLHNDEINSILKESLLKKKVLRKVSKYDNRSVLGKQRVRTRIQLRNHIKNK